MWKVSDLYFGQIIAHIYVHNSLGQPEAKGFDLQGMRITELINT